MLKKIIIGGVLLLGLGFLVAGPSMFSHIGHVFSKARSSIQSALPLEYELERAEGLIEKITPEIEDGGKVVAKEQVEIRYLAREIARLAARQKRDQSRIQARTRTLRTQRASYTIAGRSFQRSSLEAELRLAFRKFKQNQEILDSKQSLLEARSQSLAAARSNLSSAATARETLMTRVEHLRARMRQEKALEAASSDFELDAGSLSQVSKILDRCQKRLDVVRQLRENHEGVSIDLSVDEILPHSSDVLGEVEQYFGQASDEDQQTPAATTTSSSFVTVTCPTGN